MTNFEKWKDEIAAIFNKNGLSGEAKAGHLKIC